MLLTALPSSVSPELPKALLAYKPRIPINFSVSKFRVTTCHTPDTLLELFALRHSIFYKEHHGMGLESGLDIDDIDLLCDHLSIFDMSSGRLAGSYRLTSSTASNHFYSSHRFDLRPFLKLPGIKLELGRACIDPQYRKGSVIALLWRGIASYLEEANAEYLFGCASIRTTKIVEASQITRWLDREGHFSDTLHVKVHPKRSIGIASTSSDLPYPLPSLFHAYLKAGAKIASLPALDSKLRCVDFLSILDLNQLTQSFSRFRK